MEYKSGAAYTEKGSKFFGFFTQIATVADFKNFMSQIKALHPKASHYCFAYIVDEPSAGDQISLFNDRVHREKYSNDGEPSGCGNALLSLLKAKRIENGAIIVVRYWGGVLLGSGNLIRAYATAAKAAF